MSDDRWPDRDVLLPDAVIGYLRFVYLTFLQKLDGLTERQARAAMLPTSPAVSPLGLIKHVTAVWRQHIQIHIGGEDLPELWSHDDTTLDFRIRPDESVASITAAFTAEWERSAATLARIDLDDMVVAYGNQTRAGRMLVDVLQECARHLGHMDILRELIDGSTGE